MTAKVEPGKEGQWTVRVNRTQNGVSSEGTVVIRQASAPAAGAPPHASLAGARAWLALGEARLQANRSDEAVSCAHAGIEELGADYAQDHVKDDTGLKIHIADELIENGQAADGARMMLRMLAERIQMYVQRNAEGIIE
jgi:hypothetical protein